MRKKFGQRIGKIYSSLILLIDRQLVGKSFKQLIIVLVLFVFVLVVVALCYMGTRNGSFGKNIGQAFVDLTNPETLHKNVYNPNQPHQESPLGLAVVYILGAMAFTGLLIATITNIFRSRSDKFRRGAVSYKFSGHIVFLGYNNLIAGMIQKICEEKDAQKKDIRIVVGVENNASIICDKIKNRLFDKYRNCVVILQADSCNMEDLERLRVSYAEAVYIIGEHDDAYNLKCYRTIYEVYLCDKSPKAAMPQCYVNLQSLSTLTLFRTYASAGELGVDFNYFQAFNFNDEWARTVLQNDIKKDDDNLQKHFIIAGITDMGMFFARKVVLSCHYPNKKKPTIITFIENEIEKRSKHFISQHQSFFDYCQYTIRTKGSCITHHPINNNVELDFEFEFIDGDLSDATIRQEIFNTVDNSKRTVTIAICYDDFQQNITMGLNLPDKFYHNKNVRVRVYQPTSFDLGKYLKRYRNVVTFGMSGDKLDIRNNGNVSYARQINHYFRHRDKTNINYSDKRLINAEWEAISIFDRWSCVRRAEFIPSLLKYSNDINAMANIEYKRKVADKLLYGVALSKDDFKPSLDEYNNYVKAINDIVAQNKYQENTNPSKTKTK